MNVEMMEGLLTSRVSSKNISMSPREVEEFYNQYQDALSQLTEKDQALSMKSSDLKVEEDRVVAEEGEQENEEMVNELLVNLQPIPWAPETVRMKGPVVEDLKLIEAEIPMEQTMSFSEVELESIQPTEVGMTLSEKVIFSEGMTLPELEDSSFPILKWETLSTRSPLENQSEVMVIPTTDLLSGSMADSFDLEGWSSQTLSKKAEELGVEAPEAGLSQRIRALLAQVSGAQPEAQAVVMQPTESLATTEVKWEQRDVLVQRLMEHLSTMKEGDSSKLSLTLVPKHLGTMQLEFEMIQGQIRGRIVTESKEITQWMEKAIQSLSSETLSLKTVQVETQPQTGSFMFNQGQTPREQQDMNLKSMILKQGAFLSEEESESILESSNQDQSVRLIF